MKPSKRKANREMQKKAAIAGVGLALSAAAAGGGVFISKKMKKNKTVDNLADVKEAEAVEE